MLNPILRPRSVAIVGASRDPRKRGHQVLRALLAAGYKGNIFPVHPDGGEIFNLPVSPNVATLPDVPDLAFIATPAQTVPDIVEACATRGVKGAVVTSVGFRESGADGARLEQRVVEIVRGSKMRLIGPNTSGVMNTAIGLNLVGIGDVKRGELALLSQSGNVALDVINETIARSIGISIYVGVGNETDISFHEYVEYLEQDPDTSTILMYVEGFRDGRKFIDVARRVSQSKPIVLLKGGRSDRGVAAARSHTGAIAGSYPVLRAALRQGGVSEVRRSDELLPVAMTLANQPPVPAGSGIVVLADGGGHATLAADALAAENAPLCLLSDETKRKLRALLGAAANVENPVDVAGAADRDPMIFARALEIVATDPCAGGILLVSLFGGYGLRFSEDLAAIETEAAEQMAALMAEAKKPFVVHSLYADRRTEALVRLGAAGVPVVRSLEVGSRCMRAVHWRGLFLRERPVPTQAPRRRQIDLPSIVAARRDGRTTLTESEARELIAEFDVPLPETVLCRSADEAAAAAEAMGRPVVLKVVSPAIPHKTEAHGVELNVSGPDEARPAFHRVIEAGARFAMDRGLAPDIRGVLVTAMLPTPVAELFVGVRHDPDYGPVLSVGAGGVAVEVHHDTALRGLPIGRTEAIQMLDEIRIARLLNGFRGRPAANREALADVILGIAACALTHHEIEELEANPVFAYEDKAVVVDVRCFLRPLPKAEPKETEPVEHRAAG